MKRTRVLADHKQQGKILVPPFTHLLGPLNEISWIKTIIPELIWIALIHDSCGDRRAVEIITAFTRLARDVMPISASKWLAPASNYSPLSQSDYDKIRVGLDKTGFLEETLSALQPLIGWYPECPLAPIFGTNRPNSSRRALTPFKKALTCFYSRSDRGPMMAQATAIWLAFDAEILKVNAGLSLARFPEIEHYPKTELSKKIGASVRAGLNGLFGSEIHYSSQFSWPKYFWNHGLMIEPCEATNG